MNQIETKGFAVKLCGDPSVGIWDTYYRIEGQFTFDSKEELDEFKESLHKTFELLSDMGMEIDTFEELEASAQYEQEVGQRINGYEQVEASDDLKSNFRSWEDGHADEQSADALFYTMAARHPNCSSKWLVELCDNWVGYEGRDENEDTD